MARIEINDLHASVEKKKILNGINLTIGEGEIHALMGPNGSGKSTLANALMGHPKYNTTGTVIVDGEDIMTMSPDQRAKKGVFLSFQYPIEIPGVTVESFMRIAYNNIHQKNLDVVAFHKMLLDAMEQLHMDKSFSRRYLNEGFSGGEKKRMEILQMIVLEPKVIILDETDSGLDVDALRVVSEGINRMRDGKRAILLITHFTRLLTLVEPDQVHILSDGVITRSGGKELAHEIEAKGYAREKLP